MEVKNDVDIDSLLLQQFSSMATQDREVLIADFKRILGETIKNKTCAFYLDMNNWNLQAAVCSFCEFEREHTLSAARLSMSRLAMSLVRDDAIMEGDEILTQIVPPNTIFHRTWRITNSGIDAWPIGCTLMIVAGYKMTYSDRVAVDPLQPNACAEVTVTFTSPSEEGVYDCKWKMSTKTWDPFPFGEVLSVSIQVSNDSRLLSDATAQMTMEPHEMCDVIPMTGHTVCYTPPSQFQIATTNEPMANTTTNITVDTTEMDSIEMSEMS